MLRIEEHRAQNWLRADRQRRPYKVEAVVFHRIDVGVDGPATSTWFAEHGPKWIGTTDMPYHFIIPANPVVSVSAGIQHITIHQCVALSTITPHALKWNTASIGIGVVGDFRHAPPTGLQHTACVLLAAFLVSKYNRTLMVTGHGMLPDSTKDKNKYRGGSEECPGPLFDETLRNARAAAKAAIIVKE